jgi:hypothetical protein
MLNQTRFSEPTKCVMKRKETSTLSEEPVIVVIVVGARGTPTVATPLGDGEYRVPVPAAAATSCPVTH